MKNLPWSKIFLCIGVFVIAYLVYTMYKAYRKGVRGVENLILSPFVAAKAVTDYALGKAGDAATTVIDGTAAVASLPSLTATESDLTNKDFATAQNEYAPNGTGYNRILATQGRAAADANWADVQSHYAAEAEQDSADSSWWGLGNLFSF